MSVPAGVFTLEPAAAGHCVARGVLTFATARAARARGLAVLSAAPAGPLEIDCAGLGVADSAGLAVLLDWLSAARRAGRSLRYAHLPQDLVALARIGEVDELLERGV
ncbi:MAG: lipid asymmetry maintenance protein MlaB [Steroidobacterales bacterium]